MPSLSPEDLLLTLCVYGTGHCWEELKWICDIGALISSHPELDWSILELFLTENLEQTVLPDEIQRMVESDPVVHSLAKEVFARLFNGISDSSSLMKRFFFTLRAKERVQDKIRYGIV